MSLTIYPCAYFGSCIKTQEEWLVRKLVAEDIRWEVRLPKSGLPPAPSPRATANPTP